MDPNNIRNVLHNINLPNKFQFIDLELVVVCCDKQTSIKCCVFFSSLSPLHYMFWSALT